MTRSLKAFVVTASINPLDNLEPLLRSMDGVTLIVLDEGDYHVRKKNEEILSHIVHTYYGPQERQDWFRQTFGKNFNTLARVIPERCHAETSFGFLVAYEERPDLIIEIDDDVQLVEGQDLSLHARSLGERHAQQVCSDTKWYNTLENLKINNLSLVFPRGHPYATEIRNENYHWKMDESGKCVLNMGLWLGCPDLDALTILYNGGLQGVSSLRGETIRRNSLFVAPRTYFAVCSMNTSFLPEIIPAFYQLTMNHMGIDRFDDIWSGLFVKRIADHLGHKISLGEPVVFHNKRGRNVFRDIEKEIKGMEINEWLWKAVDSAELEGDDYWSCYYSLIQELDRAMRTVTLPNDQRSFLRKQVEQMELWLKVTDSLS